MFPLIQHNDASFNNKGYGYNAKSKITQ